jgi:hypothetical protein
MLMLSLKESVNGTNFDTVCPDTGLIAHVLRENP